MSVSPASPSFSGYGCCLSAPAESQPPALACGPVVKTLPSNAGGPGSIPGWGDEIPHALCPQNQNIKRKQYYNKLNKDFKNGPHQKKNKRERERIPVPEGRTYRTWLLGVRKSAFSQRGVCPDQSLVCVDRVLSALCHRSLFHVGPAVPDSPHPCCLAGLPTWPLLHDPILHLSLLDSPHAAPTQLNSLISSLQMSPSASGFQSKSPWMLTLAWIKQKFVPPQSPLTTVLL